MCAKFSSFSSSFFLAFCLQCYGTTFYGWPYIKKKAVKRGGKEREEKWKDKGKKKKRKEMKESKNLFDAFSWRFMRFLHASFTLLDWALWWQYILMIMTSRRHPKKLILNEVSKCLSAVIFHVNNLSATKPNQSFFVFI